MEFADAAAGLPALHDLPGRQREKQPDCLAASIRNILRSFMIFPNTMPLVVRKWHPQGHFGGVVTEYVAKAPVDSHAENRPAIYKRFCK